jgi:CDP-diacylglycerol--glycerol-3-phosphate 3-phosphatidyltransferase
VTGQAPVPVLNIANVLTGLRLVLVPAFLAALFVGEGREVDWRLVAFTIFAVAMATDRIDGELARRRGLVTTFGVIADPIADKALTGAALVGLSMLDLVPWWATVVIMAREVGITALRFVVLRHRVIPANRGGKTKTLVQTFAIGLYLLPLTELFGPNLVVDVVRWTVLVAAVMLTVATGVDYVVQAVRLRPGAAVPEAP